MCRAACVFKLTRSTNSYATNRPQANPPMREVFSGAGVAGCIYTVLGCRYTTKKGNEMTTMSRIATDTTATILDVFAGQTVTQDAVLEQISNQYMLANRKTSFGSYVQVETALRIAGVTTSYSLPNCNGQCFYTFPAIR